MRRRLKEQDEIEFEPRDLTPEEIIIMNNHRVELSDEECRDISDELEWEYAGDKMFLTRNLADTDCDYGDCEEFPWAIILEDGSLMDVLGNWVIELTCYDALKTYISIFGEETPIQEDLDDDDMFDSADFWIKRDRPSWKGTRLRVWYVGEKIKHKILDFMGVDKTTLPEYSPGGAERLPHGFSWADKQNLDRQWYIVKDDDFYTVFAEIIEDGGYERGNGVFEIKPSSAEDFLKAIGMNEEMFEERDPALIYAEDLEDPDEDMFDAADNGANISRILQDGEAYTKNIKRRLEDAGYVVKKMKTFYPERLDIRWYSDDAHNRETYDNTLMELEIDGHPMVVYIGGEGIFMDVVDAQGNHEEIYSMEELLNKFGIYNDETLYDFVRQQWYDLNNSNMEGEYYDYMSWYFETPDGDGVYATDMGYEDHFDIKGLVDDLVDNIDNIRADAAEHFPDDDLEESVVEDKDIKEMLEDVEDDVIEPEDVDDSNFDTIPEETVTKSNLKILRKYLDFSDISGSENILIDNCIIVLDENLGETYQDYFFVREDGSIVWKDSCNIDDELIGRLLNQDASALSEINMDEVDVYDNIKECIDDINTHWGWGDYDWFISEYEEEE